MNRPAAASLGAERFVLTLIFSGIVHGVVLLGVGFTAPAGTPTTPTLDVILVSTATQDAPDQADYLANANQKGGGDLEEKARPTAIANAPVQKPDPGNSDATRAIGTPEPEPERKVPVLASRASNEHRVPVENTTLRPDQPLPTSDELTRLEQEQAQLAAEIDDANRAYAKRPRRKFISAQTQEYAYAAYMRAWVARVERLGNLNYPPEARERQIHGELLLTVAMNRDGTVESIDVVRSSGQKVLDDAAVQIVRMSAPFNELPPSSDDRVDILHITRTWQFLPGDVLRHR